MNWFYFSIFLICSFYLLLFRIYTHTHMHFYLDHLYVFSIFRFLYHFISFVSKAAYYWKICWFRVNSNTLIFLHDNPSAVSRYLNIIKDFLILVQYVHYIFFISCIVFVCQLWPMIPICSHRHVIDKIR